MKPLVKILEEKNMIDLSKIIKEYEESFEYEFNASVLKPFRKIVREDLQDYDENLRIFSLDKLLIEIKSDYNVRKEMEIDIEQIMEYDIKIKIIELILDKYIDEIEDKINF